jgi:ubiquinone/menaquinone biosynthesis C-methylase UbiE
MLNDFIEEIPSLDISGLDLSSYAIENSMESVKKYLKLGCCSELPYPDSSFDLVISISTIHNLDLLGVEKSLKEIIRVSKNNKSFIKVNGYKNLVERRRLESWNLVAKTILHEHEWEELFAEVGYLGDYDFFKS